MYLIMLLLLTDQNHLKTLIMLMVL